MIDWENCPEVESTPGKVSGAWCFKDTRLPLWSLFNTIGYLTVEEFCNWYPYVTPEQVKAVLAFLSEASKNTPDANTV